MTTLDPVNLHHTDHNLVNTRAGNQATGAGKSTRMWVEHAEAGAGRVVLYLHAGAIRCCGSPSHQRLLNRISGTLQASILIVDYRTWPEHTISDGIDDAMTAHRYLLAAGFHADQIVLAADSADKDLTITVPMAIRDLGLPAPASVVAIAPLRVNHDLDGTPGHARRTSCALLPSLPMLVM